MILDIKGNKVLIDDEDSELLKDYHWFISANGKSGHIYVSGRKQVNKVRKRVYLHRLVMNTPKGMFTDHINGNTLDNRKENLRICTNSQNNMNQKPQSGKKYSKYKGVTRYLSTYPNKWIAVCKLKGKAYRVACNTEKEAALEYNRMASEFFGEFARLNVVEED